MDFGLVRTLRELTAAETGPGTRVKHAALSVTLAYPSAYRAAMSSLGFLQIHRLINARPGSRAVRAVLPEPETIALHRDTRTPLLTLEEQRPAGEADVFGISLAYELETAGVVTLLELSGLAPLARDRDARTDPLVVLGGPITFSNPLPAALFADVVVMGEAEETIGQLLDRLEADPHAARGDAGARARFLEELAGLPGFYVPHLHGQAMPPVGKAPDAMLPAFSEIRTPHTELSDMVLIEPERGCHRGCTFCVMRRTTNDGMRLVGVDHLLSLVPEDAGKVGLVGAAVTDHPRIKEILRALVEGRGLSVGISSLRADRLDDEFVGLLVRGGYRSMTVALDAASERLRFEIEKNLKERHFEAAAELARAHGMRHLKMYTIVGLPGEEDADVDELLGFADRLSRIIPIVLGVSPFVPKLRTPLARAPFAGEARSEKLLARLKKRAGGRITVRGPSAREAWVEYRLAQGGLAHASAAIAAAHGGGGLGAWKRAFSSAELPERLELPDSADLVPLPTRRRPRAA